VTVTVNEAPNVPPVANAGADQTVTLASGSSTAPITLDGTGSVDPDAGGIVAYAWSIDGTPVATGPSPTINLAEGIFTVTLLVTDNRGGTDDDTVTITVNASSNADPIAVAGPDQSAFLEGDDVDVAVLMDGSGSSDSDGTISSFAWLVNGQTVGTGPAPSILLTEGVNEVTLIVTDNLGATGFDSLIVTVGRSCNYDFNQDENVDLLDAQQMAQVFVGSLTPEANWLSGDLNRDENADLTDAQLLAQFVVTGSCPF
jgi:PKD repeat protein